MERLEPIFILDKGVKLPDSGNYFVIAKDSETQKTTIFLHKDTGIIKGLVKVEEIPLLQTVEAKVDFNLPKLSKELVFRALNFFKAVWQEHRSEAAVLLYYNKLKEEYLLYCPQQQVSSTSVEYAAKKGTEEDPEEVRAGLNLRKAGFKKVGTIHSHCNFGAFHSGVDISDERQFDGVHVTIGNVDTKNFTLSATLVVNSNRFLVEPDCVFEGIVSQSSPHRGKWITYHSPDKWYSIDLTEEEREKLLETDNQVVENEWVKKVQKRSYRNFFPSSYMSDYGQSMMDDYSDFGENWRHDNSTFVQAPLISETEHTPLLPKIEKPKEVDEERLKRRAGHHARILLKHGSKLPERRIDQLKEVLRNFYNKDEVSDEDIKAASLFKDS